ncbi:osmoprotectant ABC transporter substrate-binding protein [Vagococcus acidifermentans]|uniref:Osmoprotectant ABC transporter substrate-binding protein n=1 Tax=Vagococcus acidifermentans TaxID=564710 RepID=A0A430AWP4_9ENTE|nr:osmoprotectant ABC transporter substrate-binding protein [Vagococcus acidifermentans]RSU12487.1 osmoprotectant ABC transporter substrate-binding protein [Vagococcus acidifermentans]
MRTRKKFTLLVLMTLTLFLSSCSLPGLSEGTDKKAISIAAQTSTETQILANIIKGMIEHYTEHRTNIVNNLGSTTMNHQAMLNGDVNISAGRYTGTDLSSTLMLPAEKDPEKAMKTVVHEFKTRYDQTWFPSYGFANTYAFMITKETAEKYNLKKISDMAAVSDELAVGVDTHWMRREGDGYEAFVDAYNMSFKQAYPMQIGLVYDAVAAGRVDVVLGYSTDGRIASYDLVILEDDLKFFPPYDCSPLVTDELLEEYPELEDILLKLAGKIDTQTMQELNFQADNNLLEPETVAKNFLRENNFFEEGN